jgi:hypothetical protein
MGIQAVLMTRRTTFFGSIAGALGLSGKAKAAPVETDESFPPVPRWRPSFGPSTEQVVERFRYYTDGKRDLVVFRHGTVAILAPGLTEVQADEQAREALSRVFNAHPDMTPRPMDDGNVLVTYTQPIANVVIADLARQHWAEVEARHQDGLARDEVLITPLGSNVFDDFGKQALLGRCYMFMDAQAPEIVRIERATAA